MEENQEKVIFYIVFFLILVVCISIFTRAYENHTKKKTNTPDIEEKSINTNKNMEVSTNENTSYSINSKARFFYSGDNKFYLILTDNFRAYSNPDMGTNDKRFLMNIDNFYSTDSFTGRYEIKDNTIKLIVEAGCLDEDNKFNCVIPDKVEINNNIITLNYKTNEIILGTIKLLEQN